MVADAGGGSDGAASSFADLWRARENERVADDQKQRSQTAGKARYQMSKALHASRYGEALEAATAVLDSGETLPNDLMRQLLLGCAEQVSGKLFAQSVSVVSRGRVKLDENSFAALIGKLLAREAPHAQVRCALNFGIRTDAEVLSLEPTDCRMDETKDCYKGIAHDDGMDAEVSDDEAAGRPGEKLPRILEFRACVFNPRLNGLYSRRPAEPALLGHKLPVYERRLGVKMRYYVYFFDEDQSEKKDPEWRTGWYISSAIGSGETYAHCPCIAGAHKIPPQDEVWRIKTKQGWKVDHPGFTKLERVFKATPEEVEVERELAVVDIGKLRGSVEGRDPDTCGYFAHFFVLLTLEHLTELRGFRSRWGFRTSDELVTFGLCFKDVYVDESWRWKDEGGGTPLPGWPSRGSQRVAFKLPWFTTEDNCRMKRSESVIVSRGDPLRSRICEGSVQDIDFVDRRLVVTLNGQLPEDPWGQLRFRLDVYANRTSYERQVLALLEFVSMERTKICDMLVAAEVGQVDLAVLGGDGFEMDKDKLGGTAKAETPEEGAAKAAEDAAVRAKAVNALNHWEDDDWFVKELEKCSRRTSPHEKAERKAKTLGLANEDVDGVDRDKLAKAWREVEAMPSVSEAQRDAIGNSMSKRLTIVQGPPGTGKTHTSVRIITKWVQTMGYKPLLATSECNIAVDNIAIGLVKNGVKVVRMGNAAKIREELEPAILLNQITKRRAELKKDNDEDSEDAEEVGEEPWGEDCTEEWEAWNQRRLARRRKLTWAKKQERWIRQQIIEDAEVIAATTINSGSQAFDGIRFHGILIDEVAQATETSSIVPIVCRRANQLVLCGDHCQLPPSVQSREAELRGYSLSLYSRLVEAGVPFRFLDTQYRAHPMLMEFSAACIYQGKLLNGIDGSGRPSVKGVPWPNTSCPAAFFECGVEEHLEGESKANEAEAKMVCKLVQQVMDAGEIDTDEIGVVTPYKGQVRVLRRVLHKGLEMNELQKKNLEMASVDNFQGREKELIIFSAVRCNDIGSVGFLKDWRRLNVMITRARRGLVVVGNAVTLCADPHWKLWLEFTEKQGGTAPGTVKAACNRLKELGVNAGGHGHKRKKEEEEAPNLEDAAAKKSRGP